MLKKSKAASCQSAEDVEKKALAILETLETKADTAKELTGFQVHVLLLFYGVEKKKHGKNVAEMRAKYKKELKEKNTQPPFSTRSGLMLMRLNSPR